MPEDVRLHVDGEEFGGWKSLQVTRSIEAVAGRFQFELSERFPEKPPSRRLATGAAVRVTADGEPLVEGFIDEVSREYDGETHTIDASGRDAAGDLVDCAEDYSPGTHRDIGLRDLAAQLAKPFGMTVSADTELGEAFKEFQIQVGETGFEALSRACRLRAVLPVSDGRGGLVLSRAGAQRSPTALALGGNILSASSRDSMADRFSRWVFRSQERATGKVGERTKITAEGEASDPTVPRYRPMVRISRQRADAAALEARARWQANVSAGRAHRVTYSVAGFRHRNGFWEPNLLVPVEDSYAGVRGDMLIAGVTFTADREHQRSSITVVRPEAFAPEPLEKKGPKGQELWRA